MDEMMKKAIGSVPSHIEKDGEKEQYIAGIVESEVI